MLNLLELRQRQQQLILGHIIKQEEERFTEFAQESGFLPLITRDMMLHIENEEAFYSGAVRKLSSLGAASSYLYIFKEPVIYKPEDQWVCPDRMYLAAYHEGEQMQSFSAEERPVLSRDSCFADYYSGEGQYMLSVFCLFSGETQYGILVTEIEPSSMNLFHTISMQIGNALKYHELSGKQHQMQVKLERAMNLNRSNPGRKACVIYADLDHLKEINDSFGHMEGDAAIRQCAGVL